MKPRHVALAGFALGLAALLIALSSVDFVAVLKRLHGH